MKKILTPFLFMFVSLYIPYSLQAQTPKPPTIDGKINASEWENSKVIEDFHMMIPKTNEKNYDSTIVYVKQTRDAMYFAIKYWPKGKVISKSLIRDRSTEDENEFFILLDLENQNKNGYLFAFSFMDNQRDMLVYNVNNKSQEWDWVWEVRSTEFKKAANGEPGYIESEIKIPVDKLQNKNKKQIGFDIHLFSYKPDGNYYYYSLVPDSELLSLSHTHKFDLVTPFDEKLNFKFNATPYIVGTKFNTDSLYRGSFGGDINVSLDKHTLKGTVNTDESTLEADPVQFSLYSRPIFLQEKRTFFSKDLDIYRTPLNLFYTREIDSIEFGANYTFRSDKLKMGAMYVQDQFNNDDNGLPNLYKNYFVARPNFEQSDFSLGSLFIYTNNRENQHQERILSFDGFYRFPKNPFRFGAQFVSNFLGGSIYDLYGYYQFNDAGGPYADFGYIRVNDKFSASTFFNSVGLRNNYEEKYLSGGYKFVFNRPYFSDINVNGGYYKSNTLTEEPFGVQFTMQERLSFSTNYKVNEWLRFNQYFEYNKPNDFNENGELIKRTNMFQDYNASVFLGQNYFNVGYFFGPYYGEFYKNPYASVNLFLFDKVAINASINFIEQGAYKTTLVNGRIDYRFLDKFYLRMFLRKDTESKYALLNTMLQYEFFAGSSVYLVLNLDGDRLQNTGRYMKVSYEFNF